MKAKIIAECCQNHNGDLSILKDMIWTAAEAGADYVKIQSMMSNELSNRKRFETGLIEDSITKIIKRPYKEEYERLSKLDLDDEAHHIFIEECTKAKIKPLTTAFTTSRIEFLSKLPWKEIKVASYDCSNYEMINQLKKGFNHLFISTGATTDDEIQNTAELLKDCIFTFLHCVTIYPTPLDRINLARIEFLRQFSDSVGFSDHSLTARDGIKASIAAIYCGADVIERHYSILPSVQTKDGPVSIGPAELKELVKFANMPKENIKNHIDKNIPEFNKMLGKHKRELSHEELLNRDYYKGRFEEKEVTTKNMRK